MNGMIQNFDGEWVDADPQGEPFDPLADRDDGYAVDKKPLVKADPHRKPAGVTQRLITVRRVFLSLIAFADVV
jgi:hypothetical protein